MNYFFVASLLSFIFEALFQSSDGTRTAIKNDVFCEDFFNPSVRKQLIKMNLTDLSAYVDMNGKDFTGNKKQAEIAVFGKDRLVILEIEETSNVHPERNTGRDMYIFKDFVNEAKGERCFTNLILPYVLIMCEDSTYVFNPNEDSGEVEMIKEHKVSFPMLNLASRPSTDPERTVRVFQHVPGGGVVYMEKEVDFEGDTLDIGLTTKQIDHLKNHQEEHDFRYFWVDSTALKAYLSVEPEQEGVKQWPRTPPVVFWRNPARGEKTWEFFFINLTSPEDMKYDVQLFGEIYEANQGLRGDAWQLKRASKPFGKEFPNFCEFSSENVLYKRDPSITPEMPPEGRPEVRPGVRPGDPLDGFEPEVTSKKEGSSSDGSSGSMFVVLLIVVVAIAGSVYVYINKVKRKSVENTTNKKGCSNIFVKKVTPGAGKATSGVGQATSCAGKATSVAGKKVSKAIFTGKLNTFTGNSSTSTVGNNGTKT